MRRRGVGRGPIGWRRGSLDPRAEHVERPALVEQDDGKKITATIVITFSAYEPEAELLTVRLYAAFVLEIMTLG